MQLSKKNILKNNQLKLITRENCIYTVSCKIFLAIITKKMSDHCRIGIKISKKAVKLATKRNYIKRVIKETIRKSSFLSNSYDMLIAYKTTKDSKQIPNKAYIQKFIKSCITKKEKK